MKFPFQILFNFIKSEKRKENNRHIELMLQTNLQQFYFVYFKNFPLTLPAKFVLM